MAEEFLTPADDQPFKQWLAQHPQGFYLNESQKANITHGEGEVMLHEVGCHHLGSGEGFISTTYAKAASEDRKELLTWAKEKGLRVTSCRSCKPMDAR